MTIIVMIIVQSLFNYCSYVFPVNVASRFFSVNFCFNCIKLDNSNRLFNYCSCVFPVNVAFRFLFFLLNFVLTAYN